MYFFSYVNSIVQLTYVKRHRLKEVKLLKTCLWTLSLFHNGPLHTSISILVRDTQAVKMKSIVLYISPHVCYIHKSLDSLTAMKNIVKK